MESPRQYQDAVRTWLSRCTEGERAVRVGTNRKCPLSQSEIDVAVRALGTPIQVEDSFIYFQTIDQCIEESPLGPQLAEVLNRKSMRPQQLHSLLVHDLKLLAYKKADDRDELCPATLASRRQCADIWARRKPWLMNPSSTRSERQIPAYFQWEWYFDYTFMIDAVAFEDGVRSGSSSAKVYQSVKKKFGPHTVKRKKGIATTSKLMFYVMIHRHGGIVAGPSLMYSGSRVPKSMALQKGAILAPWCAPMLHQFRCFTSLSQLVTSVRACRLWQTVLASTGKLAAAERERGYKFRPKEEYKVCAALHYNTTTLSCSSGSKQPW